MIGAVVAAHPRAQVDIWPADVRLRNLSTLPCEVCKYSITVSNTSDDFSQVLEPQAYMKMAYKKESWIVTPNSPVTASSAVLIADLHAPPTSRTRAERVGNIEGVPGIHDEVPYTVCSPECEVKLKKRFKKMVDCMRKQLGSAEQDEFYALMQQVSAALMTGQEAVQTLSGGTLGAAVDLI